MYRYLSIVFCLIFSMQTGFAQIQFKDPESPFHFRIDLITQNLSKEMPTGSWAKMAKLDFVHIQSEIIPVTSKVLAFKYKNNFLLNLDGTGQVYLLDIANHTLTRLDKTFFAGYNFAAIKYLRNDTLFSLGGSGFWHSNNIESFFSTKSKEWEMYYPPTENDPERVRREFGGYDPKRDAISIIEFPEIYSKSDSEWPYRVFEKSFKSNKWEYLGNLNISLFKSLGFLDYKSSFINGLYFFKSNAQILWANPVTNELFQINQVLPLFNNLYEQSGSNGFIYSYHFYDQNAKDSSRIKIDSISTDQLKSISQYKGKFYVSGLSRYEKNAFLLIVILCLCILIWLYMKKRNNNLTQFKNQTEPQVGLLDRMEPDVFHFLTKCLAYPIGYEFSSQAFTEIMGFSNYAYETQRQVRSKLIKSINFYFSSHYQMNQVIIRKVAKEDKRFTVYIISEEHYERLNVLIKNES